MSNTSVEADQEDISHRLLESAEILSYDPSGNVPTYYRS